MKIKSIILICFSLWLTISSKAQISVINANISAYNITPQGICQFNIINQGAETRVALDVSLSNANGEKLVRVRSQPFVLKSGLNSISGYTIEMAPAQFSTSSQGQYLQNAHTLPSGKFTICCTVISDAREPLENYCEDIESDMTAFLNLVIPNDKETIETQNPVLIWTHSEPFNILTAGEYFRLAVVEMQMDQTPEAAMSTNVPVYMKDYVSSHQVQYPSDAKTLEQGKTYAWQVQKISNASIIKKSEAWEFKLAQNVKPDDIKYAVLKSRPDNTYYVTTNGKLYFTYFEEYNTNQLNYSVYNSKNQLVKNIQIKRMEADNKNTNMVQMGSNKYMLDADASKLDKGTYTLQVINPKKESFKLSFVVD
jgi:hypothetical protein